MREPGAWSRWGPPPQPPGNDLGGRLAPASITQLIEIGARILRRHWGPLVASFALFGGVAVILGELASANLGTVANSMMRLDASGRATLATSDTDIERMLWAAAISTAASVLLTWCLAVASVVAAAYVDGDYRGRATRLREALRLAIRRGPVALVAAVLTSLVMAAIVAGMLLVTVAAMALFRPAAGSTGGLGALLALIAIVTGTVGLVVVGVRLSLTFAAVALEPVGPLQALRRSWHLTGDNTWRAFGLSLTVLFVAVVMAALIGEIVSIAVLDFVSAQAAVAVVVGTLTTLAFAPVLPVMLAALYFDLRVRRDRLELSLDPHQ